MATTQIVSNPANAGKRGDTGRSPNPVRLYLSPDRFFPSIITLLNTRLIRVWYPGPFDLNQSTTSVSMRNEILSLRGRFQRGSAPVFSSASDNSSSSTDACRSPILPGRSRGDDCRDDGRAFRRFVFLVLGVITLSYIL